jgi:acyl dehydratase
VGQRLGVSPWIAVEQSRIDAFAAATLDPQWIHLDAKRAAAGPFGTTIAHGFLTLSLLPWMLERSFLVEGVGMRVNYGLNRVRFPAPVPVGSRLRGLVDLMACEPIDGGGLQITSLVSVQRQDSDKPVCVAESVARLYAVK